MNYSEKEINIIKQRAHDKGVIEGVLITILIFTAFLCLVLYNLK